jgi:hypothetical protein
MDAYRGDRLSPAQVMAPADAAARVMLARWCSPSDRLLGQEGPPGASIYAEICPVRFRTRVTGIERQYVSDRPARSPENKGLSL